MGVARTLLSPLAEGLLPEGPSLQKFISRAVSGPPQGHQWPLLTPLLDAPLRLTLSSWLAGFQHWFLGTSLCKGRFCPVLEKLYSVQTLLDADWGKVLLI